MKEEKINVEDKKNVNDKKNKNKNKIVLLVIIIIILFLVLGYFVYDKYVNHEEKVDINDDKKVNEVSIYEASIDAYGDAVTFSINNYMKSNGGRVPTWDDIADEIYVLKDKVSCDKTINYDGTVYLENCIVAGITYTSDYVYGKKIENTKKSDKMLYIYEHEYSESYWYNIGKYKYDSSDYGKLIDTYQCYSDDCDGYNVSPVEKIAIIFDNSKYYLYNYDSKKSEEINLGTEKIVSIEIIHSDKKNYGLYVVNSEDRGAFYNLENKEYVTKFIYSFASSYDVNELLDNNYFAGSILDNANNKCKLDVINNSTGNVVITLNDTCNISSGKIGNYVVYFGEASISGLGSAVIYNRNFKPFANLSYSSSYDINSDNTITISKNDEEEEGKFKFYVYDGDENLLKESGSYKKVVKVVKDYVIVLDDEDNLKLVDKNDEYVTTFLKVTSNYTIHSLISGWHTENGKNGIYMVIENLDIPYGTEGSGLEYYYIPSTNETGVIMTEGVGGYAKPVLYLYPTEKTRVTVAFEKPYLLTTTYPKYQNNWTFTAYSNGDLYDKDNQYYYGLYWEEDGSSDIKFDKGFYVTKDEAIEFLEEKTNEIGFTRREANEFIMYWLPILEKNGKNLVYFELTEERENYNKLKINPIPDSMLRVAIHVKKVDRYTEIEEQKLSKFNRVGFSVVEWGGVLH